MKLLEQLFSSKVKIKILRKLVQNKDWLFNLSELSKDLEMNKGIVSRILRDLVGKDLVKSFRKGRIILFQLNKENKFVKDIIIQVYELERDFPKNVKDKIGNAFKGAALSVIIYGSYARDDFDTKSDIDLMVIAKDKKRTDKIAKDLSAAFLKEDLNLVPDVMSLAEFRRLYKRREPLILNVIKEGKVLHGRSLRELHEV